MTLGSKKKKRKKGTGRLPETRGANHMVEDLRLSQMNKRPSGSQPKDGENKSSSGVSPSQDVTMVIRWKQYLLLDFLAAYCARRSSFILAASSSS